MTDVNIFQTDDGGEINITNGTTELTPGLDTAVYLSLFGGNEQDPGEADKTLAWWGNDSEVDEYRSKLQYLLRSIPSIPANLRRLEQAALQDLQWMAEQGAASSVEVVASMPGLNKVKIIVTINGTDTLTYAENWNASTNTDN